MKLIMGFGLFCCAVLFGCKAGPEFQPASTVGTPRESKPNLGNQIAAPPQSESWKLHDPGVAEPLPPKTPLVVAPPMPAESIGLHLWAEPRKGKMGAPYQIHCNVTLQTLNNSSIPVWLFPRVTFYAEQAGEYYPLRTIEHYPGGIWPPNSISGASSTLPRPPRSGRWKIFAIQEHSEMVYHRHLQENPRKIPLVYTEDQDDSYAGMWLRPLVSNVIVVDFAEIGPAGIREAEDLIRALIEAGQYRNEFRYRQEDPRKRLNTLNAQPGFRSGIPCCGVLFTPFHPVQPSRRTGILP